MPSHESVKRGLPPAQVGKVPIGVDVSKSGEPPAVGYSLVESSDLAGGGGGGGGEATVAVTDSRTANPAVIVDDTEDSGLYLAKLETVFAGEDWIRPSDGQLDLDAGVYAINVIVNYGGAGDPVLDCYPDTGAGQIQAARADTGPTTGFGVFQLYVATRFCFGFDNDPGDNSLGLTARVTRLGVIAS